MDNVTRMAEDRDQSTLKTQGARLRWAREKAGYTQAELAKLVGMTPVALSRLELDESKRSKFLGELAEILGFSATWLRTGEKFVSRSAATSVPYLEWEQLDHENLAKVLEDAQRGLHMAEGIGPEVMGIIKRRGFCVRVPEFDTSMIPLFQPGDRVICDLVLTEEDVDRIQPGSIVLAFTAGNFFLRQLRKIHRMDYVLMPASEYFPALPLSHGRHGKILAVAIERRTSLDTINLSKLIPKR